MLPTFKNLFGNTIALIRSICRIFICRSSHRNSVQSLAEQRELSGVNLQNAGLPDDVRRFRYLKNGSLNGRGFTRPTNQAVSARRWTGP